MDNVVTREAVEDVFRVLMVERGTPLTAVDRKLPLYEGGYGLDSMDTATLSAMLADQFERDPYSFGKFPRTLGEIQDWYAADFSAK
jgi:hypothetical protein